MTTIDAELFAALLGGPTLPKVLGVRTVLDTSPMDWDRIQELADHIAPEDYLTLTGSMTDFGLNADDLSIYHAAADSSDEHLDVVADLIEIDCGSSLAYGVHCAITDLRDQLRRYRDELLLRPTVSAA